MRRGIRFLLGDELREVDDLPSTMTVLDWLRLQEQRVGTKEGCNEGDCGACTVVVVRPFGDRLRYQAVNACIQPVGTLDGCQLITIEHLATASGTLHSVQQSMVDSHGSQCGFCTPGFVMSMFALTKLVDGVPCRRVIDDGLAGNLCRCTGYAPIIRALESVCAKRVPDQFDAREAQTLARLAALCDEETVAIEHATGTFYAPASIDALSDILLANPHATIVAGSTDVGLWVTKHMRTLDPVVWIGRVRELQTTDEAGATVEIGAAVTYTAAMPLLAKYYPDIESLFRRLGSTQIRNAGTVGGNIANGSPIGDASPALIALGATLHLRRGQEQRSLPLQDCFMGYGMQDRRPGEFVARISVPKPTADTQFRAYKISKRFDQDISAVMGAFLLRLDEGKVIEARVAFGGMAETPKRAIAVERALSGGLLDAATVAAAKTALATDFSPISDMRASAGYRLRVAQNLIERLFVELAHPAEETRLDIAKEAARD